MYSCNALFMASICFYFQLHQPYRLGDFDLFDLGIGEADYFAASKNYNQKIFQKVAQKSYLPMLALLLQLTKVHENFKFTLSATGIFLEQAQDFAPQVIELLQSLAATGQVEFLSETYHHTLASLYSPTEFAAQVKLHRQVIKKLFNLEPKVFRNTELVYSNQIAELVAELGFAGMLTEAVPRYLGERPKTQVYWSQGEEALPLLLKHAQLSDDIAFRFSQKSWAGYPLTADKYYHWLTQYYPDELINLFMDLETFGEHQWEDTGIFKFFEFLIDLISNDERMQFVTPSEVFGKLKVKSYESKVYDVPEPISWADVDRDLTAWIDNPLQQDCLSKLYELEIPIKQIPNSKLLETWRRLQTSDHFYYMCTKWAADGDVHAYFSPYESPLEAYRKFSIVLADLTSRLASTL